MIALALGALALASPAAASTAGHHDSTTIKIKGGYTNLVLDTGTAKVLAANKVSVTPVKPAWYEAPKLSFPITYGKLDAKTLGGYIKHEGGLQFKVGDTKLQVKDFIIDTKAGVLTARIGGTDTRFSLLNLNLSKATVAKSDGKLIIGNVRGTLTAAAAAALNKTFKVNLFKAGLPIGTATVKAEVH